MNASTSSQQGSAGEQPADGGSPPQIWEAERFSIFRKTFSPREQRELLEEDTTAEMRVCMILAVVITAGLILASTSVLIIRAIYG